MDSKTRQRLKLILLFALFAGPLLLAWLWYTNIDHAWLQPKTVNKGTLIQPPRPLTVDGAPTRSGTLSLKGKWTLVVAASDCAQDCKRSLYVTRQVRIALGKDLERVQRLLVTRRLPDIDLTKTQPDLAVAAPDAFPGFKEFTPPGPDHLLLVDPLGNVMMYYPLRVEPKDLHDDLKRLLRYSQTG